jgi:hypothetical protein
MGPPKCTAQTVPASQTETTSVSGEAKESSKPEPETNPPWKQLPARFLPPPPRPQTFRLQRGIRAWDREGQQRLQDARQRLWSQASNTREKQAETSRRLQPESPAETTPKP